MVGPTAQLVSLVLHFNARVRGLSTVPFFPSNTTCKFCEYVRFVRRREARTPDDWMKLEARPRRRAVVAHQDWSWQLVLTDDVRMDVWEAEWEIGNQKAADQRIWRVDYRLVKENVAVALPPVRSPEALIPVLRQGLTEILAFSEEHQLDPFSGSFRSALECLSDDDPFEQVDQRDFMPAEVLGLPAKRVMAACQAGWVFGGMGSWNDMGFDDDAQIRYDRVTGTLSRLLHEGICSAANSSAEI